MKQFLGSLCVVLLLLAQVHPVFAASTENELTAQLEALQEYIARVRTTSYAPLTQKELKDGVLSGAAWILNAQEENGHFKYEYVPYEDTYLNDDNIVRQGGALFILGEVYKKQENKDTKVANGIEKAAQYFETISQSGANGGKEFRCVTNFEGSKLCKLGATALVLSGILGYVEGNPSVRDEYDPLIEDYVSYILAAQKEEGGFSDAYRSTKGFADDESPFSNGEALLALVRAYQYEKDARLKESIDRAFSYLEGKEFDSPLYLWIMAALKDMQALWPQEKYVEYTKDFTAWRMARASRTLTDRNYCAYIEGVASAYSVLQTKDGFDLSVLRRDIDLFNAYHKKLQLSTNDSYHVLFSPSKGVEIKKLTQPTKAYGGFLTAHSVPTERIDFTQHCVSAYLQTLTDIDNAEL